MKKNKKASPPGKEVREVPGFVQKYLAARGKEPFEVLAETHKEIYKLYEEQQQKKKQEEQDHKHIKKLAKEFAQEIQKELNKLFK